VKLTTEDKVMIGVFVCMIVFVALIVLAIIFTPDEVQNRALERQYPLFRIAEVTN